jgi:hypothetical protein
MNRFPKYQGAVSDARPQISGDLFGIMVLVILLGIFLLSGCQDSFMKQATADKTSAIASLSATVDEAGNITTSFDPNSGQTQVLKLASGALSGSAVAIPPGSLAIPVSITVGEGETLASSSFTQQIGLTENSVTAAGPSVSFIPSTNVQASSPFTLSLPFSMASLALTAVDTENVIVMFRSIKVDGDQTSYEMGVIPRSEVTISSDKVSFQTKQFGVFQVAKTEKKISQGVIQATNEAPVLKKEAGNPLLGAWESCRVDGRSNTGNPGTDPGINPGANPGTNTPGPLTWINVGSKGYFDQSSMTWTSRVSLNWSGGHGPFTVKRYGSPSCLGTAVALPNTNKLSLDDFVPPPAQIVSYKIMDFNGQVSSCQPVQVITEPKKIQWSSVVYRENSATVNWIGQVQPYEVSTYLNRACDGRPTRSISRNDNSEEFINIGSEGGPLSVKVSSLNGSVTSNCLDLKSVNLLFSSDNSTPVENLNVIPVNSVVISASQLSGRASQIAINFTAVPTGTYAASRFSQIDCPAGEASIPLQPIILGYSGSVTDGVSPSEQASYLISNATAQAFSCINFSALNNMLPVFSIANVSAGPKGINFSWDAGSIISERVKLTQYQGFGCTRDGEDVTSRVPDWSGYGYVQNVVGLQKGSSYSFKLATTDNSATAICLNAQTTDGDLPLTMLNDRLTVTGNAATNVTNGSVAVGARAENQQEVPDIGALGSVPGQPYSRLKQLKITKNAYIMRQDVFTSKDCTGYPVSSNTEHGVFVLPAVDLEGTIPIDLTQKDLNGAIFTQEGVDIANKLPNQFGCGLTGWVKGTVRKLGDSKCGEADKTHYERLKVDGDRLYMCGSGQNKDYGNTQDMRIPSCDITPEMMYFTRQK